MLLIDVVKKNPCTLTTVAPGTVYKYCTIYSTGTCTIPYLYKCNYQSYGSTTVRYAYDHTVLVLVMYRVADTYSVRYSLVQYEVLWARTSTLDRFYALSPLYQVQVQVRVRNQISKPTNAFSHSTVEIVRIIVKLSKRCTCTSTGRGDNKTTLNK